MSNHYNAHSTRHTNHQLIENFSPDAMVTEVFTHIEINNNNKQLSIFPMRIYFCVCIFMRSEKGVQKLKWLFSHSQSEPQTAKDHY